MSDNYWKEKKRAIIDVINFFEHHTEALEPKRNRYSIRMDIGDMVVLENKDTHHQLIIFKGLDLWHTGKTGKAQPKFHKPNASVEDAISWLNPRH